MFLKHPLSAMFDIKEEMRVYVGQDISGSLEVSAGADRGESVRLPVYP